MIEQADDVRTLLDRVRSDYSAADKYHAPFRDKCKHYYSLYRNCSDFQTSLSGASPRSVDDVRRDGQREFGAELFIPYTFWTVETVLPRLLSNNPTVNILPRSDTTQSANVENMKFLIDSQNEHMQLGSKLLPVGKDGLMYGLGVGKTYWHTDKRMIPARIPRKVLPGSKPGMEEDVRWDDPMFESVDPWDFFWDPYGQDIASCEYVIQRSWRSMAYVKRMIESGVWDQLSVEDLPDIEGLGPHTRYEEVWADRRQGNADTTNQNAIHEVWEWHDGAKAVTVLDNECVAKVTDNYWHGEKPFQIYRPTVLSHEFIGIGEIEPIEHLQQEMNTLRTQRRDNATMVLQKVIAYAEGIVDPDDIRLQPAGLIPLPGDPRELLMPIEFGDIPYSGYQEETGIREDIERTSGIADATIGKESRGDTTATEIQLTQSAANVRIQQKTKILEQETITSIGNQEIALNQQKIASEDSKAVRVTLPPKPGTTGPRWEWRKLKTEEIMGAMECLAVGGATSPENVPQMRQDATLWQGLLANPQVDPRMVTRKMLECMGVKDPETFMGPHLVPPALLEYLVGKGVSTQLIGEALEVAEASVDPNAEQAPPPPPPEPQAGPEGEPEQPSEPDPAVLAVAQASQEMTAAVHQLVQIVASQGPPVVNAPITVEQAEIPPPPPPPPPAQVIEAERPKRFHLIGPDGIEKTLEAEEPAEEPPPVE